MSGDSMSLPLVLKYPAGNCTAEQSAIDRAKSLSVELEMRVIALPDNLSLESVGAGWTPEMCREIARQIMEMPMQVGPLTTSVYAGIPPTDCNDDNSFTNWRAASNIHVPE
jgi:hypothetical protein